MPRIAAGIGASRFSISVAYTIAQISGSLSAPLIGFALDRYSPRLILLIGLVLLSIGYALIGMTGGVWQLYITFGLFTGVGWTTISNFGSARILVEWFKRRLGLALAIDALGASLAGVIIAPAATALITAFGWRAASWLLGLTTFAVGALAIALLIRSRPSDIGLAGDLDAYPIDREPQRKASAGERWSTWRMLTHSGFWAIAWVYGLMGCVWSGINLHLFAHLSAQGLTALQAATVLSVEAAAAACCKPLIGVLADALGVRRATVLALALQLAGVVLFTLAHGEGPAAGAALVYGMGLSGIVGLNGMAVARAFGAVSYGLVSGWLRAATLPLSLVGAPLAGYIYDRFGHYEPAFWCYAAMLVAALPAIRLLHRQHQSSPSPAFGEARA